MVRKCIRSSYPEGAPEIQELQLFCPICAFWGNVRRRVRTGVELFPGITGPPFAEKLRGAASQFGRERPERLGTNSIRRGAAMAILEAGGSFAQLHKAGQ